MGIPKVKLGYARVSKEEQNIENQILKLKNLGVLPENIYHDHGVSGTVPHMKRKGFKKLHDRIKNNEAEELYVFEISRLGRTSIESLLMFIEIEQTGCKIISLSPNETWTKIMEPGLREVFVSIFSWFADIERKNISERTKLGLQRAKEEGKHLGRKFKEPDRKQYEKLKASKLKTAQIARVMQIPTSTMYRWVERWEDEERIESNRGIKND